MQNAPYYSGLEEPGELKRSVKQREREIDSRREMAGEAGATPTTYSPSPTTQKTKSRVFKADDIDWVRPDGRGFHQCRPACKLFYPCNFHYSFLI